MRRNGQRLARFVCLLLLALGGIVATTALSGCGSNSGGTTKNDNGTQYTITVTAASGSVNPTTTVTLTLQ
jgi:ABC-type Fe3+-hydroxamate transport system substrate-binding protein